MTGHSILPLPPSTSLFRLAQWGKSFLLSSSQRTFIRRVRWSKSWEKNFAEGIMGVKLKNWRRGSLSFLHLFSHLSFSHEFFPPLLIFHRHPISLSISLSLLFLHSDSRVMVRNCNEIVLTIEIVDTKHSKTWSPQPIHPPSVSWLRSKGKKFRRRRVINSTSSEWEKVKKETKRERERERKRERERDKKKGRGKLLEEVDCDVFSAFYWLLSIDQHRSSFLSFIGSILNWNEQSNWAVNIERKE